MFDGATGLLGQVVHLRIETDAICALVQFFSTIEIKIEASHITQRWAASATSIDVTITEHSLILQTEDGKDLFAGVFWHGIQPHDSTWETKEGSLRIILAKNPSIVGSWPYIFQSLAFAKTPAELECVWEKNKEAWEDNMKSFARERRLELLGLKTAFAQDVYDQIGPGLVTSDRRPTFCFPLDSIASIDYLNSCRHIPSVGKLLNIAGKVLRTDILVGAGADPTLLRLAGCLIAGLAAIESLRAQLGLESVKSAHACYGYGPAEYAALVFSGALRYEDALRLILVQTAGLRNSRSYAISSIQRALEGMSLQEPRIATFSGGSGQRYDSIRSIRERLPIATCRDTPSAMQCSRTKAALLQQGYGSFIELVQNDGDLCKLN